MDLKEFHDYLSDYFGFEPMDDTTTKQIQLLADKFCEEHPGVAIIVSIHNDQIRLTLKFESESLKTWYLLKWV